MYFGDFLMNYFNEFLMSLKSIENLLMAINYCCSQTKAYLHNKRTHISHMGKISLFGKTDLVAIASREERNTYCFINS